MGTVFILAALVEICLRGQASGYEISIYAVYSAIFWFFLTGSIAIGILVLVLQAHSETQSSWRWVGFLLIVLGSLLLILLPFVRGYYAHGFFDPLSHIGRMRDIQHDGHFPRPGERGENVYPSTFVLAAFMSSILELNIETSVLVIPALFYAFYTLSAYLLSTQASQESRQALVITAFVILPVFTSNNEPFTTFIPRMLTFFVLPFAVFLYLKSRGRARNRSRYSILLVILLSSMVFFHPLDGSVFLVIALLCFEIPTRIVRRGERESHEEASRMLFTPRRRAPDVGLLPLVLWFVWFSPSLALSWAARDIRNWLVYGISNSEAQRYLLWLGRAQLRAWEAVLLFVKRFGHFLLYSISATAMTVYIWRKWRSHSSNYMPFSLMLMVFSVLLSLSVVAGYELGSTRFFPYTLFASAFVDGLGFCRLFQHSWGRVAIFLTIPFLVVVASVGMLNSYWSPFTAGANQHVTFSDVRGASWFFSNRDAYLLADQITFTQINYARALLGARSAPVKIRESTEAAASLLEHFGYPDYGSYGAWLDRDRYFLSNELDKIYYSERIPEYNAAWKWSPTDFRRLSSDQTVNQIYSSGGFEVLYVRSCGKVP